MGHCCPQPRPLQEAEPETAGKMQELALAEGALPRHFHTALFTASSDSRMLTHRQLSRHLIGLWVTGNPTANALLRRMLVGGALPGDLMGFCVARDFPFVAAARSDPESGLRDESSRDSRLCTCQRQPQSRAGGRGMVSSGRGMGCRWKGCWFGCRREGHCRSILLLCSMCSTVELR